MSRATRLAKIAHNLSGRSDPLGRFGMRRTEAVQRVRMALFLGVARLFLTGFVAMTSLSQPDCAISFERQESRVERRFRRFRGVTGVRPIGVMVA
jgi:hypothetical protein